MELTQTRLHLVDKNRGIAQVTLNRPEKMNSYTPKMADELVAIFEHINVNDAIRVVIVTGAGNRAFCAGFDVTADPSEFPIDRPADYRDIAGKATVVINRCRKPVIAAINGPAIGVGITMCLPMDLRIVAEDAKIGFVFVRRGLILEGASSYFLPRLVGHAKAIEWTVRGHTFLASEEAKSGLFTEVVPASEVFNTALKYATEIADNNSPMCIALTKGLLNHPAPDPETAHLIESRCVQFSTASPDFFEGVFSFREKRPPNFEKEISSKLPDFYPWWKEVNVAPLRSKL